MVAAACISVVVPVFNEHDNIGPCLRGLWEALRDFEHEILIVYDFDDDTTLAALAAMVDAPPTVRLVKNEFGPGAANALRTGFAAARGDVVISTMADLSDPPQKLVELAHVMRSSGVAVVAGSRYAEGGSQRGGPLIKRMLSRCAGVSLRLIAGLGTHDSTTNFKAYSRSFLARTTIEAQGAFDIGLELTVKAHLQEAGVAEVPSSWNDRSAGASRFKVWSWAPKYLRWYWAAMREPLAVWLVWLVACWWEWNTTRWTGDVVGIEPAIHVALALAGGASILLARRLRGRTRWFDALAPLAWSNPPLHSLAAEWTPLWSAVATLALLGVTTSRAAKARLAASVRVAITPRRLGTAVLALFVWLSLVAYPTRDRSIDLDPSWQRACDYFLTHGLRAGVDYVFTYGPLGALNSFFDLPGVFWSRRVLFEVVLKGLAAWMGARAIVSGGAWIGALGVLVALSLRPIAPESSVMIAIALIAAGVIARRRAFGWELWVGVWALTELALVKFSWQLLIVSCIPVIAFDMGLRRSAKQAWTVVGLFALSTALAWSAAGQRLADLPAYWRHSAELAGGYQQAMAHDAPGESFVAVTGVLALMLAAVVTSVVAQRGARESWSRAAIVVLTTFLAFKAGHIHAPANILFPEVATVVAVLLYVPSDSARRAATGLAWTLVGAFSVSAGLAGTGAQAPSGSVVAELWQGRVNAALATYGALGELRATFERDEAIARAQHALPRITAEVGSGTIDVVGVHQALAPLNGWNYRPRPVFQSYAAYTPELLDLNARFFASERAPDYVLWRALTFDHQPPLGTDAAAVEATLARYRPVLREGGFVLWKRDANMVARTVGREPVLRRALAADEWVEIPVLPGKLRRVAFAIDLTPLGRLRSAVLRGPVPLLDVRLDNGRTVESRLVPGAARWGWLIDPFVESQTDVDRALCGIAGPRVIAIRWRVPAELRTFVVSTAQLEVEAWDDPLRDLALERNEFLYGGFSSPPAELRGHFWSQLLAKGEAVGMGAPGSIGWQLEPGVYTLGGFLSLPQFEVMRRSGDGARVSVRLAKVGRADQVLWSRELTPELDKWKWTLRGSVEVYEPLTAWFDIGPRDVDDVDPGAVLMRDLAFRRVGDVPDDGRPEGALGRWLVPGPARRDDREQR